MGAICGVKQLWYLSFVPHANRDALVVVPATPLFFPLFLLIENH
jgi:hypothetical protein